MSTTNFVAVSDTVRTFVARDFGLFIDGEMQPAHGRAARRVRPATGERLATVADADAHDVDRAVASAKHAFDTRVWSGLRPADRERILLKLADLIEADAETLAQLETLNQGKSIHVSRAIEVGASVEYVRYMAGWATKITGQTLDVSIPFPPGARYTAYTRKEPVGVVAAIVPWNFPLMIAVWKLIPALAAGCTIVLKPSPETPLTALRRPSSHARPACRPACSTSSPAAACAAPRSRATRRSRRSRSRNRPRPASWSARRPCRT